MLPKRIFVRKGAIQVTNCNYDQFLLSFFRLTRQTSLPFVLIKSFILQIGKYIFAALSYRSIIAQPHFAFFSRKIPPGFSAAIIPGYAAQIYWTYVQFFSTSFSKNGARKHHEDRDGGMKYEPGVRTLESI